MASRGEKNEKTEGKPREQKRADCSRPKEGQSSSVTLVPGQAELSGMGAKLLSQKYKKEGGKWSDSGCGHIRHLEIHRSS